ncbi:MAG TPA: hypothetical protein VH302_13350 [Bryobacteraceae bacterium]|jgi:hypothetical protein|nr:hypothetical protein [Bryobacteraceae bacterium]
MAAFANPMLTGTVAAAICDEEPLSPNALAWVTSHFLIIRNKTRQNHTIIPLTRLAAIDVVKTPYSGLLVIAAGVFIIAAAAFASKHGDGAAIPSTLLGGFFLTVYFGSRRANITFTMDSGVTEMIAGTLGDATDLIQLIESARMSAIQDYPAAPCVTAATRSHRPSQHAVLETVA